MMIGYFWMVVLKCLVVIVIFVSLVLEVFVVVSVWLLVWKCSVNVRFFEFFVIFLL